MGRFGCFSSQDMNCSYPRHGYGKGIMLKPGPELFICEPFGIPDAQKQDPNHWAVINIGEHLTMMPKHEKGSAELKCSTTVLYRWIIRKVWGWGPRKAEVFRTSSVRMLWRVLLGTAIDYSTMRLYNYATIRAYDYSTMRLYSYVTIRLFAYKVTRLCDHIIVTS